MREIQGAWVPSLGQEDPLEKEMATHSSILVWEILWAGALEHYSPWGHRVGGDWAMKYGPTCAPASWGAVLEAQLGSPGW